MNKPVNVQKGKKGFHPVPQKPIVPKNIGMPQQVADVLKDLA